ncbi:MAG: hypothetical protein ACUVQ1_06295 [Candidatus Kapaibacteriales bacterium]
MKYTTTIILLLFLASFAFVSPSLSQSFSFQISSGLSTPNNEINNVYNSESINLNGKLGEIIRQATKLGYFIGINANLPLSKNFVFNSGISLHRFPQSELKIIFPGQPSDSVYLKSVQNIIPISIGVNWYIFKSPLSPYITGNLSYNYIVNSIDIVKMNTELPVATSNQQSRMGAGFGIGIDLNLQILTICLEIKYNYINLIGKTSNETNKNYLDIGLGIIFGNR